MQIVAYITDVMGGRSIPAVSLRGSLSEAYDLIRRVFQQLAAATAGEGEDVVANAAFSTESPAAMTALMNGELYLGQGLMDSATMAFQSAVEADSNYALAWYRLTLLHDWNGHSVDAAAAAARAEANADQLPAHDRRLLQGFRSHMEGDVPTAEAIYQELLEQDPDDFEALMQLGYLYWGHNWRFGRTMVEAVVPLRRASRVNPHSGPPGYLAWALMAGSAEDPSMLDEVDSIVRMHNWTGFELAIAGIRAMRLGDSIGVAAAMDSIGGFGWCTDDAQCFLPFMGMIAVPQFMRMGMVFGDVPNLAMFVPLIETLVDSVFLHDYIEEYVRVNGASPDWRRASGDTPSDVSRFRRIGYSQLADLNAGQGRWGAVRSTMRALDDIGDETSAVKMAMMATLPIPGPIPADADSLRRELMEWDVAGRGDGRLGPRATILEVGHHVRLYLLGLLSAREGDFQAARDYADQVEALEPNDLMPTIHLDLAAGVRADVLLREGQPGEALAVLEAAPRKENNWAGFGITGERELFLRGRALWELGRYQEAVPWYTINGLHPGSLSLLAPSHYYKGQIYEDMGDTERARWHYAAFVELWRNADPEYQPFVEEALGRMAQLGE